MGEDQRTIWCGNLSENVTEELLYELFLQAGPLQRVHIPKSRDGKQRQFGFITFKHECSVPYALALFEGTVLFKREIKLQSRNPDRIKLGTLHVDASRNSSRNRSQSLPAHLSGSESPSNVNFETLLLLGQNLVTVPFQSVNHANKYTSQSGAGHYLGGINKFNDGLSNRSLQGNWQNRNHPYSPHNNNSSNHNKRRERDRDRHHHNHRRN